MIAYLLASILCQLPTLFVTRTTANPITALLASQSGSWLIISINIIMAFIAFIFLGAQYHLCAVYTVTTERVPVRAMWDTFSQSADQLIRLGAALALRFMINALPLFLCYSGYRTGYYQKIFLYMGIAAALQCLYCFAMIYLDNFLAIFLLLDNPSLTCKHAMAASRFMMRGHRLELLYLQLSFIGLYLTVFFSFGITILWVHPYVLMTNTKFYYFRKKSLILEAAEVLNIKDLK